MTRSPAEKTSAAPGAAAARAVPKPRFSWCCANGCGACAVKRIEFEYERTETMDGELVTRKTEPRLVSACCGAELTMWDNLKDEEVYVALAACVTAQPTSAAPAYDGVTTHPEFGRRGAAPAVNQCDGCLRGLRLTGDLHRNADGRAEMVCTADRYAAPAAAGMPQPVASGWQLVPVEPTAAMLAAVSSYGKDQLAADAIWRAMLAATPPTPASEVAQDAARYRFLFLEEDWCRDPLWPLVAFFRDGNSIPKAQVDAAIDAALNQGERHGDSGSKTA